MSKSFTKIRPKCRIFALYKYLAIKFLIRILRSYPYFRIFQNKKKERFCAAPSCSMPHACKKCGRLKKSRPTAQTFYNGAKVRIYFLSCKFPLKNLRKMSFTSLDLFGACWMRSSTSKSKLMVRTFVVLPLPFGVLFHLLFFSSCSIIFLFLLSVFACGCVFPFSVGVSLSLVGKTRHKPLFCYIFNCSGVRFRTRLAAYTALLVSCLCHALFFGDHLKPLPFSSCIVCASGFSWCLMRSRSS